MLKIVVCSDKQIPENFTPESGDVVCFVTGTKQDRLDISVDLITKLASCKEIKVYEAGENDPVNIAFELGMLVKENKGKDYKVYSNMKQLDGLGKFEKSTAKTIRKPRAKKEKTEEKEAAPVMAKESKEQSAAKEAPASKKTAPAQKKSVSLEAKPKVEKTVPEAKRKGSALPRKFAKDEAEVKKLLMENGISANYAHSIFEAMQGASDVTLEMNVRMKLAEQGVGPETGDKILNALTKKYLA